MKSGPSYVRMKNNVCIYIQHNSFIIFFSHCPKTRAIPPHRMRAIQYLQTSRNCKFFHIEGFISTPIGGESLLFPPWGGISTTATKKLTTTFSPDFSPFFTFPPFFSSFKNKRRVHQEKFLLPLFSPIFPRFFSSKYNRKVNQSSL